MIELFESLHLFLFQEEYLHLRVFATIAPITISPKIDADFVMFFTIPESESSPKNLIPYLNPHFKQ